MTVAAMAPEGSEYDQVVRAVRASEFDADAAADRLVALMTDAELLGLLDGDSLRRLLALIPWLLGRRRFVAGSVPRLGIPGIRFSDLGRGPPGITPRRTPRTRPIRGPVRSDSATARQRSANSNSTRPATTKPPNSRKPPNL